MKNEVDFDIGIIGGGPAGSTIAAYLAKAGLRCMIFEKEIFPRPYVGESLVPSVMRIFSDLVSLSKWRRPVFRVNMGPYGPVRIRGRCIKRIGQLWRMSHVIRKSSLKKERRQVLIVFTPTTWAEASLI